MSHFFRNFVGDTDIWNNGELQNIIYCYHSLLCK